MSRPPVGRQNAFVGMMRIARGQADGVLYFGATPRAYLASLAPLIAFPLVSIALSIGSAGPLRALTQFALTLCAAMAPAVLSFELARLWRRTDLWLRFATAFNWCELILPVVACLIMVPLSVAISGGLSEQIASLILLGCLIGYGLWLHWFLARKALGLSPTYAFLMVVLVNLGTAVSIIGPRLLAARLA
jgi:hypothetical protein